MLTKKLMNHNLAVDKLLWFLSIGHLVTDEPATAGKFKSPTMIESMNTVTHCTCIYTTLSFIGSNSQPGSDEPQAQQPTADQEDKKNR